MKETHRGWTIEIVTDRFGTSCWVTGPNGEEHKLYVPQGQDVAMTLAAARAFINRLIRIDEEEATWQR